MADEQNLEEIEKHAQWEERNNRLQTARFLRTLAVRIATLEKLVYVPGLWRCAKCELKLVSNIMCASTGNMAANNSPQQCANGCGPMWRVTEREAGNDMIERCTKLQERLAALEAGGMVMVPVCATADMKAAGRAHLPYNSEFANTDDDAESVWDAMLAARPQGGK